MKKQDFETYQASEISRSCQNFPRPTFFEVPFATPRLRWRERNCKLNTNLMKVMTIMVLIAI